MESSPGLMGKCIEDNGRTVNSMEKVLSSTKNKASGGKESGKKARELNGCTMQKLNDQSERSKEIERASERVRE